MMLDEQGSLLDLLLQHLSWYPRMELRDIYKLLYQGVLGSEHLNIKQDGLIQQLQTEFENLICDPNQRLLEPVRQDGALYRLNLRAYKSKQVGLEQIYLPLLETSQQRYGTKIELQSTWKKFTQLCEEGHINNFQLDQFHSFCRWLEKMEYPPVHHSEIYRCEYQPAYRLIGAAFLPLLG